jgi:hypothetical protein
LKTKALLRDVTAKAETLLRSVMMSSVIPSLKYSCSGSPLMLAKGSTQIETRAGPGAEADGAKPEISVTARAALLRAIMAPSARTTSWA